MARTNGEWLVKTKWPSLHEMDIYIGDCHIMTFEVNPRHNSGGAKRPKTQAVYLSVSHPQGNRYPVGGSISFKEAFQFMEALKVPLVEKELFIHGALKQNWGDSYEIQKTQEKTLF